MMSASCSNLSPSYCKATISASGYLAINKWVLSKFHCKCGHDVRILPILSKTLEIPDISAGKVRDIAATGYVPWSDPVCWEKQSKCVPGRAFFMSTTFTRQAMKRGHRYFPTLSKFALCAILQRPALSRAKICWGTGPSKLDHICE